MPTGVTFRRTRDVLTRAIAAHVTPAAAIEVGAAHGPAWSEAFGTLTYDADSPAASPDTIFDLASLTKVLATTALVMRHVECGSMALDDTVASHLPAWSAPDRADVRLADLLAHASGLPAHALLFTSCTGGAAFEDAICRSALAYPPRSASLYSDLGFSLLGRLLERWAPLDRQFETLTTQMGPIQDLQFLPPDLWLRRTAPTRVDPWRQRLLVGEVDDDNAYALGGVAAHAGLFGTTRAVGDCARHLLQVLDDRRGVIRRDTVERFTTRWEAVADSSRALGWDTMRPSSSCGTRMSSRAFGHTGFTGTSLWIDPVRNLYVVLLTNRVHPRPDGDTITALRRAVHDAVAEDLERGGAPPGD